MRAFHRFFAAAAFALALLFAHASCSRQGGARAAAGEGPPPGVSPGGSVIIVGDFQREEAGGDLEFAARLSAAMRAAELPEDLYVGLLEVSAWNPAFAGDLGAVLAGPRHLRELVDKQNALPPGFSPPDLVPLGGGGEYRVARAGLALREPAARSLAAMAAAARGDGVALVAASAYRSYDHQAEVHERLARQMGRAAAERVSARPGHSQHQTGLALDFAPIDESFALTPAGRWVGANAARFGWSLSYPDGYEGVTGYAWEPWHFRYLGAELAAFKHRYFRGVQQFALRFLHEWERH